MQVEHGGQFSNYTVERIIKESPLVQIYRNVRAAVDVNFRLTSLTTSHSDPNMTNTFKLLLNNFIKHKPHEFIKGRNTEYEVDSLIEKGLGLWQTKTAAGVYEEDEGEELQTVVAEDIVVEL